MEPNIKGRVMPYVRADRFIKQTLLLSFLFKKKKNKTHHLLQNYSPGHNIMKRTNNYVNNDNRV